MRTLLFWVLLMTWAGAKAPLVHPTAPFAFQVPKDWTSPAADQWCSPDGTISLVWSQVRLANPPEQWLIDAQHRFPGNLMGQLQKLTVDDAQAGFFMGEYQGRIQRVYLISRGDQGVLMVCSCSPSQSFAAVAVIQELFKSFHWRPNQGK